MRIDIDTVDVEARVQAMSDRIRSFGRGYVAPELVAWQEEDMRRSFPNVEVESLFSVFTRIWPRSRTWDARRKQQRRVARRSVAGAPRLIRASGGERPILRPELFDRLVARMQALMADKLSWSSVKRED